MTVPAIRAFGLTKLYGRAVGIEDLDLEVEPGEIYGFLGPNGAGKTTTLRLLLSLMRPTRGRAAIFGLDVHSSSLAIRARTGYLPGELSLYGSLTGRELLRYLGSLRRGLDDVHARELAERFGADLDRPVRALSHGNRQKLGLIQALVHRPDLLILDEPTLGLDPLVQLEVYALLQELRASGCTVFFSSHVLPEVERVCDRVAMVRAGRLIAVEAVESLRGRSLRRMEISLERAPDLQALGRLEGVEDLVLEGKRIRCTVRGPAGPLMQALVEFGVQDLTSHQPGLEEFFLGAYEEEDPRA